MIFSIISSAPLRPFDICNHFAYIGGNKGVFMIKSLSQVFLLMFFLASCAHANTQSSQLPATVPSVDLNKYLGLWYEVASIPQWFQKKCVANTTAEYSQAEKNLIKVFNSCETEKGDRDEAEGRAQVVDTKSNSKLKVTFVKFIDWIFAFGGNYWILDLKEDYSLALIGDPSLQYAWVLSRTPSVSRADWIHSEQKFKSLGYDTCKILISIQSGGEQTRTPLCQFVTKL